MFRFEIIEESLSDKAIAEALAEYLVAERTESVEGDEYPLWHIKEYRVPDEKMRETAEPLPQSSKKRGTHTDSTKRSFTSYFAENTSYFRRNAISNGAK